MVLPLNMMTIIGSPLAPRCSRRAADPLTRLRAKPTWRPLARGCCILLAAGLGWAGLSAAEPASTDSAPLRVGVSPVFPPMIFKQQKEFAGVEADLARALGEHLGRRVVFVEVPWKDQIETLNAGKTDIIMSTMSVTPARRALVSFSKPYFLVAQIALVRREDQNHYLLGFPAIAGTSPCFAMTAFNFSISGGPPASTMAAASLKKSGPRSAGVMMASAFASVCFRLLKP